MTLLDEVLINNIFGLLPSTLDFIVSICSLTSVPLVLYRSLLPVIIVHLSSILRYCSKLDTSKSATVIPAFSSVCISAILESVLQLAITKSGLEAIRSSTLGFSILPILTTSLESPKSKLVHVSLAVATTLPPADIHTSAKLPISVAVLL